MQISPMCSTNELLYDRLDEPMMLGAYPKASGMWHTKSQNLNVSRLVLQLYIPNPLKPGTKSRIKI